MATIFLSKEKVDLLEKEVDKMVLEDEQPFDLQNMLDACFLEGVEKTIESIKENQNNDFDSCRTYMDNLFEDLTDEEDLNDMYDTIRELLVCSMSDRAEKLGIDPDTL